MLNFHLFHYEKLFEQNPVAMMTVTGEGLILSANLQARHLLESEPFKPADSLILDNPLIMQKLKDYREFHGLDISLCQAGLRREYRIDGRPVGGRFRSVVLLTIVDITASSRKLKQLAYRASHDSLTGALNRRAFLEKVEMTVNEADKLSHTLMVVYIDIDDFKRINSEYGYEGGDRVLVSIAGSLTGVIGKRGVVGRVGGDEFAVCMNAVPSYSEISEIILKLTALIRCIEVPYKEHMIPVSASYGASLYSENGESASAIVERADKAMHYMQGNNLQPDKEA
ncbi:MAG: diguanylate cyclase/phosphodiesterase [Paenibacillaceae bacterium]|nr:diguanylate cyclase/phosphodiesterase [Paenibacillaceae bacterium]